jgi:hypothetical protein
LKSQSVAPTSLSASSPDIETILKRLLVYLFFLPGKEIHQKGREARLLEHLSNVLISRAVTAASASVSEDDCAPRIQWQRKIAVDDMFSDGDRQTHGFDQPFHRSPQLAGFMCHVSSFRTSVYGPKKKGSALVLGLLSVSRSYGNDFE